MIIGYYLHLPFFSFHRMMTERRIRMAAVFIRQMFFSAIAVGVFILFMARIFIRTINGYKFALLAPAFLYPVFPPFLSNVDSSRL